MIQKVFLMISEISRNGEIEFHIYLYSTLEKAKKACINKAREEFKLLSNEYDSDYDEDEVKEEYGSIEAYNSFYIPFNYNDSYINMYIEEKEII